MSTKYPNQIVSFKRTNMVLSVDCKYSLPDIEGSPLEMHSGWSRICLNLIDKRLPESTKVLNCNIPYDDVAAVAHKIKTVYDDKFLHGKTVKKKELPEDSTSKASAVTFGLGKYKGKTPAEVVMLTDGPKIIGEQIKFLTDNLTKFPNNKVLIESCEAALKAFNDGTLNSEVALIKPENIKTIYTTPLKFLASKTNEDGKNFVYAVNITCDYTKDKFPWAITIVNGWSTLEHRPGGAVTVSQKLDGRADCTINLSDDEAYFLADRFDKSLDCFELTNFRAQFKLADEISRKNYEASKK